MSPGRTLGIILLVIGVVLLVMGINASHSVADRVSDTFTGRFTRTTTWYILGGTALGVLGLVLTLLGARGKRRIASNWEILRK
jgi:hypothetical protein